MPVGLLRRAHRGLSQAKRLQLVVCRAHLEGNWGDLEKLFPKTNNQTNKKQHKNKFKLDSALQ